METSQEKMAATLKQVIAEMRAWWKSVEATEV